MPEIILNGPEGRLEARYSPADAPDAPIALVLHPHPLHGGTMNNKVVYTMYHAFAKKGFSVMRMNFRGVGRSQGEYDKGEGELSDAATALDWLQQQNENARECWIGGFSFGAWIAMQLLMRRPEIVGFIAASPPANMYDFSFLAPCPSSGLILQGDQDKTVPPESVDKLIDKLRSQKGITIDYNKIENADHFFASQLDHITTGMHNYLDKRIDGLPLLEG